MAPIRLRLPWSCLTRIHAPKQLDVNEVEY